MQGNDNIFISRAEERSMQMVLVLPSSSEMAIGTSLGPFRQAS